MQPHVFCRHAAIDFDGIDPRTTDLDGIDLRTTDLDGINLRTIDIDGIDLRTTDLDGFDLWPTDLDRFGPRVPLLPQHPPSRQLVPKVRELIVILCADVHREDVACAHALHDVSRQVVDVAAIEQQVPVDGIAEWRQVARQRHAAANVAPEATCARRHTVT